jgi:hypothetical protein
MRAMGYGLRDCGRDVGVLVFAVVNGYSTVVPCA